MWRQQCETRPFRSEVGLRSGDGLGPLHGIGAEAQEPDIDPLRLPKTLPPTTARAAACPLRREDRAGHASESAWLENRTVWTGQTSTPSRRIGDTVAALPIGP